MTSDRLGEVVEAIKRLAQLAADVAESLPAEYRRDAFVETFRYLLSLGEGRPTALSPVSSAGQAGEGPESIGRISLAEFVNMLSIKPKSNAEWITVFAYYMKHYEGKERFSASEVRDYFRAIGLKIPGNLSRDIRSAVRKGYIASDAGSNYYYITRTGEEFVRGILGGKEQ